MDDRVDRVDLSTAIGSLRRRPGLALLVLGLTLALGMLATALTPKTYASTSTVLVGDTTNTVTVNREDILASRDVAATYTDLARRQPILGEVVTELGLDEPWFALQDRVQVNRAPGNDQLIVVSSTAPSEQEANRITRAVTERLIALAPDRDADPVGSFVRGQLDRLRAEIDAKYAEYAAVADQQEEAADPQQAAALQGRVDVLLRQLNDMRGNYTDLRALEPRGSGPNSLQVLEPASAEAQAVRPDPVTNLVAAALIGLLLAIGACQFAEHRSRPAAQHLRRREAEADRDGAAAEAGPDTAAPAAAPWLDEDARFPRQGAPPPGVRDDAVVGAARGAQREG